MTSAAHGSRWRRYKGIGDEIFARLLVAFGSAAQALLAADEGRVDTWLAERRRIEGRPPFGAPTLVQLRDVAGDPQGTVLDALASRGLWTLTALDADYPARLRDLDPAPLVINGLGDARALRAGRAVAVVGTRRPTPAGRSLAARVAARLVECRAVVVSGLAVGIDGAAHAATLEQSGTTVAVIGAGHNFPGPRAHARLRDEIVAHGGALVSEHHPSVEPRKGTYPRRNRIIAALGDATIVVEAPRHSGARITAALALELGRPVFIAPGRVGDWATAGSLALLRETPARPLVGLDELAEDLGYLEESRPEVSPDRAAVSATGVEPALDMLGPAERAIARRLCQGPVGLDTLVVDTGLAPAVVSSAMTFLLLRGWANVAGPAYIAAGPLAR